MKFGVREICDVVFRAKTARTIGSRKFYKNEPVLYFDSLKTSTLEGAVTTVYATGGKGNSRLVAWDGERTLTFTMEDALISDIGIAILASAGLISATEEKPIMVHATSTLAITDDMDLAEGFVIKDENDKEVTDIYGHGKKEDYAFAMFMKNGEIDTEPYVVTVAQDGKTLSIAAITKTDGGRDEGYTPTSLEADLKEYDQVIIDYYVSKKSGVTQVEITPETFGGNFYIEASTLFRDQVSGVDMPAEFIIPNGKVQSNFTFTMASSGDPSTFTFTVDAMPDYTRFGNKKVLAAIQVITEDVGSDAIRTKTDADAE